MPLLDLDKFAKVMEMLRSPFDGERLAAIERANAMLDLSGVTWTEFVRVKGGDDDDAQQEQPRTKPDQNAGDVAYCAAARGVMNHAAFPTLSEKQRKFIEQMATQWHREVSPAQRNWIDSILDILERKDAAA